MYLFSDNIPCVRISAAVTLVYFTVILRSHTVHRLMRGRRVCVDVGWVGGGGGGGTEGGGGGMAGREVKDMLKNKLLH